MLSTDFPNQPILTVRIEAPTWKEAGKQFYDQIGAERLLAQKNLMDAVLEPHNLFDQFKYKAEKDFTVEVMQYLNTDEINDFILGGLDSEAVKNAGLTEFDLQYLNNPYFMIRIADQLAASEAGKSPIGCTFGAYTDEKGTTALRNFDFVGVLNHQNFPKLLTAQPMETYLKIQDPKYPNAIFMPGVVGVISNLTFINEKGLLTEINSNDNVKHPFNLAMFTRKSIMSQLVVAMTQHATFSETVDWASTVAADTPIFLNITGPNPGEILSLDMLPFDKAKGAKQDFVNIPRSPIPSEITKIPSLDINKSILVCTNDERQAAELAKHTSDGDLIEEIGFFSEQRYLNLIALLRENLEQLHENPLTTMCQIAEKTLTQEGKGATVEYPLDPNYPSDGVTCRTLVFCGPKSKGKWRAQQFSDLAPSTDDTEPKSTWTTWKKFKF